MAWLLITAHIRPFVSIKSPPESPSEAPLYPVQFENSVYQVFV